MNILLDERSLDWALVHLTRFGDNDFFPGAFEFKVFADNWSAVKPQLLAIDLSSHMARPPLVRFAAKPGGSLRLLHRLDPVDSIIYTALVYEIHEALNRKKESGSAMTAQVFGVEPAASGSFFSAARHAWPRYVERISRMAQEHQGPGSQGGWVLMTDIQDFFGRIRPQRLVQTLGESGVVPAERLQAFGRFLSALCTGGARGMPPGPGASTVLSEWVLDEIDRKVMSDTGDFARWGDDYRIFFRTKDSAEKALKDLSAYLQTEHEMMLEHSKTRIVPVEEFLARHFRRMPKESGEAGAAEARLNEFVGESAHPISYAWMTSAMPGSPAPDAYARMRDLPEFAQVESTYLAHFDRAVNATPPDLIAARRILRKAAAYRIPSLLPVVLAQSDKLAPVIREMATYLYAVLDEDSTHAYTREIRNAWEGRIHASAYINEWWSHLFTKACFNKIDVPAHYGEVADLRHKALIAMRRMDIAWIRNHAANLDSFDTWDRRGVLYACSLLSGEERAVIAGAARRGIAERCVAKAIAPGKEKLPDNYPSYGNKPKAPDNYPSYGDKAKGPDNYPSYGDKAKLPYNYPSYGDKAKGPDNYPSYGDKAKGPDNYPSYGDKAKGPDNYPSYGDKAPDNYPAYGTKALSPTPRWLMESTPELDELLDRHGSEIMVSIHDSVDSGNCIAGSLDFYRDLLVRLGLPPDTATLPAKALLADRDDPLTRRAARVAAFRYGNLMAPSETRVLGGKVPAQANGGSFVVSGPDNYPSYGTKAVLPTPQWLLERIPELDRLIAEHGGEIMVGIQESVDAGNCSAGSEAYWRDLMERRGLPRDTSRISASLLLSDRDDPLTRRATRAAAVRWKKYFR
jgi:hypothetical protein